MALPVHPQPGEGRHWPLALAAAAEQPPTDSVALSGTPSTPAAAVWSTLTAAQRARVRALALQAMAMLLREEGCDDEH